MSGQGYVHYYVYDVAGKIVRIGTCSEGALALQTRSPGEQVIDGDQDIGISLMLAAQAGKAPTHKVDLSDPQMPMLIAMAQADDLAKV